MLVVLGRQDSTGLKRRATPVLLAEFPMWQAGLQHLAETAGAVVPVATTTCQLLTAETADGLVAVQGQTERGIRKRTLRRVGVMTLQQCGHTYLRLSVRAALVGRLGTGRPALAAQQTDQAE